MQKCSKPMSQCLNGLKEESFHDFVSKNQMYIIKHLTSMEQHEVADITVPFSAKATPTSSCELPPSSPPTAYPPHYYAATIRNCQARACINAFNIAQFITCFFLLSHLLFQLHTPQSASTTLLCLHESLALLLNYISEKLR